MIVTLDIPEYNAHHGIKLSWENNFQIMVKNESNEVIIVANKEGLISLAQQLLTLAQTEVPSGCHIHYDENNSLEDGSVGLIIQKS